MRWAAAPGSAFGLRHGIEASIPPWRWDLLLGVSAFTSGLFFVDESNFDVQVLEVSADGFLLVVKALFVPKSDGSWDSPKSIVTEGCGDLLSVAFWLFDSAHNCRLSVSNCTASSHLLGISVLPIRRLCISLIWHHAHCVQTMAHIQCLRIFQHRNTRRYGCG